MEAAGGVLQLGVLMGGQLGRTRRQKVGVGVWLNCGWALMGGGVLVWLHEQEGPTGLGAGDSALVALVTKVSGRGS